MKVSSSDRFYNHSVITYPDGSETIEAQAVIMPEKVKFHTVTRGQTLEMIAQQYYGNSQYAWLIAQVNDVFSMWDFDEQFEGQRIQIPDLNEFKMRN